MKKPVKYPKTHIHFSHRSQQQPQHSGPRSVGLLETEVGITQFVGSAPGFAGVIKARFSDFQVNEIDIDGNEVNLTDVTLPKVPKTGTEDTRNRNRN